MNINERIRILFHKSNLFIRNFNLFPSIPPSNDEHQLQNERISTRLFILLLISSMGILLLYTSLINVTQTVNIKAPTIAQYSQLYSTYSQTLTCPCTNISINYETFIQLQYTFHQVCSSFFVSQTWFEYLFGFVGAGETNGNNFRLAGFYIFQALSSFCELINGTISQRLTQFYSTQYVSGSVIPLQLFQSQTDSFILQFKLSTTNEFFLSLSAIRNTTQSNALFSGTDSNYEFYVQKNYLSGFPVQFGNCSCATSATCSNPARIFNDPTLLPNVSVTGIYIACYTIESLLQSDLRCIYNQTCINIVLSYSYSFWLQNPTATALNTSLSSRFFENSTIEEIVNQLMVEEWNPSVIYENYYNECQPLQCIYTHQTKNSIIYIITTLVGLIGGLTTALKLTIPRMVKFITFCIRKWRMRRITATVMPIIQT